MKMEKFRENNCKKLSDNNDLIKITNFSNHSNRNDASNFLNKRVNF